MKLVPDQEEGRKRPPTRYGQLTFSTWLLAWDQYPLAAAMLNQMSIGAALTHKLVVAKVAQQAAPKRGENLAVVYDMLLRWLTYLLRALSVNNMSLCARRKWENESGKLGKAFYLEAVVSQQDADVLKQAEALYDSRESTAKVLCVW